MNVETWLWIGTIGMLLGMVLLYLPLLSNKNAHEEAGLLAHFYVPMLAFTSYMLMALGGGALTTHGGRVFYFARYADWSVTTPLLLYSLVTSGLKGTGLKSPAMLAGLLGADVYMIVTGFIAGLTDNMTIKWSFYITSCISFLAIYALLFGPFRRMAATGPHGSEYARKSTVLALVWLAYPIVFIIGQEGMKIWSATADAALYTSLDLIAKIGYGLWAVSLAKKSATANATADGYTGARAVVR